LRGRGLVRECPSRSPKQRRRWQLRAKEHREAGRDGKVTSPGKDCAGVWGRKRHSYTGSSHLSREGTSDCGQRGPVTGNAIEAVSAPPRKPVRAKAPLAINGGATGVSEARSQRFAVLGKKTPHGADKVAGSAEAKPRCRETPDSPPRTKAASFGHESETNEAQVLVVSV